MAYSQAIVLAGGIAHVPILITALKFADNKTLKLYKFKEAALDVAKEKAAAEKAAKAEAQKAAAAEAAAAAKAQKAEATKQESTSSDQSESS